MPRDWFYRSSLYAVAGGTIVAALISIPAMLSQPKGEIKNPLRAYWTGRSLELSILNERFGNSFNAGVFMYAAFFTFYVLDVLRAGLLHLRAGSALYLRSDS